MVAGKFVSRLRSVPSAFIRQIWSICLVKQVNTILPVGDVPGKTRGIGEGIKVRELPSKVGMGVGDGIAVGKSETGVVVVGKSASSTGVEVAGCGTGRFCKMKNNQAVTPQRVSTPQPNPPKRKMSKNGRSFFGDCIN